MDVLDRLTNKTSLEEAYEKRSQNLITIDAEDLAARVKATRDRPGRRHRCDRAAVAPAYRGAAAGQAASRCSASPARPASARRISPRSWPRNCTATAAICTSST